MAVTRLCTIKWVFIVLNRVYTQLWPRAIRYIIFFCGIFFFLSRARARVINVQWSPYDVYIYLCTGSEGRGQSKNNNKRIKKN